MSLARFVSSSSRLSSVIVFVEDVVGDVAVDVDDLWLVGREPFSADSSRLMDVRWWRLWDVGWWSWSFPVVIFCAS